MWEICTVLDLRLDLKPNMKINLQVISPNFIVHPGRCLSCFQKLKLRDLNIVDGSIGVTMYTFFPILVSLGQKTPVTNQSCSENHTQQNPTR